MSTISDIVQVTISRETTAVSQPSFGIPGIIAEFATSKTTVAFARYRYYTTLAELTDDGWLTTDEVYLAANAIFAQNPVVDKILVGRKDSADLTWADAFTAIQNAQSEWYTFSIIPTEQSTVVLSADLVTSNSVAVTVNGDSVTPVVFATDHDTTMSAIITAIEADITGATATLTDEAGDNRTFTVDVFGENAVVTVVVALGATQATATITASPDIDIKAGMAWAETQKKIFFYSTSDVNAYDSVATSDLGYFAKNGAYDRTSSFFYLGSDDSYIEEASQGEALPFAPGSQTWAYKTLAGIQAYALTGGQRSALYTKNYNTYTTRGGVNVTEEGKVASGEYIDVMIGVDWLESRLETEVFTKLVNMRKVPYDDGGILVIKGAVESVLNEAVRAGVLIAGSVVITTEAYADISTANKLARNLPDVKFTALLQGAIQKVAINGTVSV